MSHCVTVTAETDTGRSAIQEVMQHSYEADTSEVPAAWARARVVGDVPVSYILVDPHRAMEHPSGDLPYAFICDVATRNDRRHEGHFVALMNETLSALRNSGHALAVTHGRHQLYRQFGFSVFTHHCGIFLTAEQIERRLGVAKENAVSQYQAHHGGPFLPDHLVLTEVTAVTLDDCKRVLRQAAHLAHSLGKLRICIEHPAAPSYGSRYPMHAALRTRLSALAQACGGELRIVRANPDIGHIPDADWIKVLDVAGLLRLVTRQTLVRSSSPIMVTIETEDGTATLSVNRSGISIKDGAHETQYTLRCRSSILAQLVMSYLSFADAPRQFHEHAQPAHVVAVMNQIFHAAWRLSRNESWVYAR